MTLDDSADAPRGRPAGARFDGWEDYREWSARDFRQRVPDDEVGTDTSNVFVVEVLTHLAPISLPDMTALGGEPARCRIGPGMSRDGCLDDEEIVDVRLEVDLESALIRPYVRAGGRVQTAHPLQIESVLSSTGAHHAWRGNELGDDHLQLCEYCRSPQSVAELAVALNAPIGLVKVLIGDAIDRGLLMLHETAAFPAGRAPVTLLRRVHASLAKLA